MVTLSVLLTQLKDTTSEHPMTTAIAKLITKHSLHSINSNTSLKDTVKQLLASELSSLPVVDEEDQVIGIIDQQQCHRAMLNSSYYCDKPVIVNDIMNTNFITITNEQQLADISILTAHSNQNIFPVIANKRLANNITRSQIPFYLDQNLSLCN